MEKQYKEIVSKNQFQDSITTGVNLIADIVGRTLGPGGLPILIERDGANSMGESFGPLITKDGVTVANACSHPDARVDLVIQSIKAICQRTNQLAGDGTTSAIVLGRAILINALEALNNNPLLNPQIIRVQIEKAYEEFLKELENFKTPIKDMDSIKHVATLSANGDRELGDIIGEAFNCVGAEGVITVDEGHNTKTTLEHVDGFQIRRGAESHDRFFNNQNKTKFIADGAYILLYDGAIRSHGDLFPALKCLAEKMHQEGKLNLPPLIVVANEFSSEVLQFLLIQRLDYQLQVCAVKGPNATSVRTQMLDDMAVYLGGYRLGNGQRNLESVEITDFGRSHKVIIDKYTTTFYVGAGEEETILERVDQLKEQRKLAESPYDAAILSDRIAALSGGVAKIAVGGSTELEIKERYHRIEDALNAARAAVEEGISIGGGVTLIRIAQKMQEVKDSNPGRDILIKSLYKPFETILQNIGFSKDNLEGGWEAFLELLKKDPTITFDAEKQMIVNGNDAGIIDPSKVLRISLQNAISVAALLSTTGGALPNIRK